MPGHASTSKRYCSSHTSFVSKLHFKRITCYVAVIYYLSILMRPSIYDRTLCGRIVFVFQTLFWACLQYKDAVGSLGIHGQFLKKISLKKHLSSLIKNIK